MRLKEARKAANLTQAQVAAYVGVNQNTYSYWENEKTKIDNLSLQKLAKLFSVSIDYLLGNDVENSQTAEIIFTTEEIMHIKKYRQLNADGKKEVESFINFKLKQQNEKNAAIQSTVV